jgi:hypothetical protein
MTRRWMLVAAAAATFALGTPLAHADDDDGGGGGGNGGAAVTPLTGQALISQEIGLETGTLTVTGTCNPTGTSTFEFEAAGFAGPPYAGTFTESGTLVLGPFGVPGNPNTAVAFESTFTIDSPAGTVTGTKSMVGFEDGSLGVCGEAVGDSHPDAVMFQSDVSYTATITTAAGTGTDTGTANVSLADLHVRGEPGFNGYSFGESFVSSGPGPGGGGGDDDGDDGDEGDDDGGGDG